MKKNNSYHCAIITEMTKEFQNLSRYSYLNFLFTLKNKHAKVMEFSKKTKNNNFMRLELTKQFISTLEYWVAMASI